MSLMSTMSEMRENKEAEPDDMGIGDAYEQLYLFHDTDQRQQPMVDAKVEKQPLHPPLERLRIDQSERIPTPVDERGLVDVKALIQQVVKLVDGEYVWRGREDAHHLYWFGSIYSSQHLFMQDEPLGRAFRALPLHIVRLPRELHDFLHAVTLPIEAPSLEVMEYRLESWQIARSLFNSARILKTRCYLSNEEMARRVTQQMLRHKFKQLEDGVDKAAKLPSEFRFFELRPFEAVAGVGCVSQIRKNDIDKALRALAPYEKAASQGILTLGDAQAMVA